MNLCMHVSMYAGFEKVLESYGQLWKLKMSFSKTCKV